jgi:sugar phosphate isomerase/epimerase
MSNSEPARLVTRTGKFPIGFRQIGSAAWHEKLDQVLVWARDHQFSAIDLLKSDPDSVELVHQANLKIGSIDFLEWRGMVSPDAAQRKETLQKNIEYIKRFSGKEELNFFTVMLPEKPEYSRSENFRCMVESYKTLVPVLESQKARIVIEGWPGPGALCCTPEGLRAFFKECPSPVFGVNYDPSHLIRMGIDPLRFLREFANRVYHIHAKDTEPLEEGLYEFGNLQPPTFAKAECFGGMHWRYAIPGHGVMKWSAAFEILADAGYQGCVSVELEDTHFFADGNAQKEGLLLSAQFLRGC